MKLFNIIKSIFGCIIFLVCCVFIFALTNENNIDYSNMSLYLSVFKIVIWYLIVLIFVSKTMIFISARKIVSIVMISIQLIFVILVMSILINLLLIEIPFAYSFIPVGEICYPFYNYGDLVNSCHIYSLNDIDKINNFSRGYIGIILISLVVLLDGVNIFLYIKSRIAKNTSISK